MHHNVGEEKASPIFFIAAFLAAIPVWIPTFPPMTDLPQHAAQIAMISRFWDTDFPFSHLYEVNWFTPYLFGYGLLFAVSKLSSVLIACKIVVSLTIVSFLLSASLLRKTAGGRREWDWLLLPVPYGFVFEWGFLNFFVGAPVAMLFAREAIVLSRTPDRAHAIRLAIFAQVLFFVHVLLTVFFCFVLGLRAAALATDFRTAFRRLLPFVSPVPITLLWALLTLFGEPQAQSYVGWDWTPERFSEFFCLPFGLVPTPINTLLGVALFCVPWISGGTPSRRLADWIPFTFVSIILLLLPSLVFGNYFTYQRFGLFAYPLYLMAFSVPASLRGRGDDSFVRKHALHVAVIAAIIMHAESWQRAIKFESDTQSFESILSMMAPNKRALGLILDRQSDHYQIAPVYLHYVAWYPALRGGAADFSFASFIPQILRYTSDTQPNWGRGSDWTPGLFHWRAYHAWEYDYFLVRSSVDFTKRFFKRADCPVRLVARIDDWWLYERLTGTASEKSSCAFRYNLREHPESSKP